MPERWGSVITIIGSGARLPRLLLLKRRAARRDLGISREQVRRIKQDAPALRTALQSVRKQLRRFPAEQRPQQIPALLEEFDKMSAQQINKHLSADQQKRLMQMARQINVVSTLLFDSEVKQILRLTAEQHADLTSMYKEFLQALTNNRQRADGEGLQWLPRQMAEANQRALAALHAEQLSKWTELVGRPFRIDKLRKSKRRNNQGDRDGQPN